MQSWETTKRCKVHVTKKKHLKVGKLREKKADGFGKIWERLGKYARGKIIQVKGKPETQREEMRGVIRINKNKRKINQAGEREECGGEWKRVGEGGKQDRYVDSKT